MQYILTEKEFFEINETAVSTYRKQAYKALKDNGTYITNRLEELGNKHKLRESAKRDIANLLFVQIRKLEIIIGDITEREQELKDGFSYGD